MFLPPAVPYPPLNISRKIVDLSQRAAPGEAPNIVLPERIQESRRSSRQARDVPLMEEQEEEELHTEEGEENTSEEAAGDATHVPFNLTRTAANSVSGNQTMEADSQSDWLDPTEASPADREDEFVNAEVPEYEDSNEPGSAMGVPSEASVLPTKLPPILLELRWLPPRPPTSYDGFNIYIYRDGEHLLREVLV